MAKQPKTAITPTREEDYPEWYQQVIKAAELAEISSVRGCMVIRPWGYGIWENMQRDLDRRFKETGHENAYFPLFIPLSYLEREAEHVEGFAKECAVVTHHRLEERDGKLVPAGQLEEPLIVRPTSETIIGESFAKWIQSYRDLPVLINQWANVVRWEMRPRIFLRTAEFLWQEGHTVHASEKEAMEETMRMLGVYQAFAEEILAIPVIPGEKSLGERFPGAERTFTIEGMMQDRKALQCGTSHYLGQNFAKASDIKFLNADGELEYGFTTSWGLSTRMIGGVIMTHGDDDGLRLPPRVVPKHVVVMPITPDPDTASAVLECADQIANSMRGISYHGNPLVVTVDRRDIRGGEKNWQWIKRGIPIRIEVGPRDLESGSVMLSRRDQGVKEKEKISKDEVAGRITSILDEIQAAYFEAASSYLKDQIVEDITGFGELKEFFTPKNPDRPEIHGGFARVKWSEKPETEGKFAEIKTSIRCIPLEQSGTEGKCVVTGEPATTDIIVAKSY